MIKGNRATILQTEAVSAVAMYFFNVSFRDIFEVAYGRPPDTNGYFREKLDTFDTNALQWYGELDHGRRDRVVGAAVAWYRVNR